MIESVVKVEKQEHDPMGMNTFLMGLLLGVRQHCKKFDSWGDRFDNAFYEAIRATMKKYNDAGVSIEGQQWVGRDPVFGHVDASHTMILLGLEARLITLDSPGMRWARFRIGRRDALRMLREIIDPKLVVFSLEFGEQLVEAGDRKRLDP